MFSFIPKEEHFFDLLASAAGNAFTSTQEFNSLMHEWSESSTRIQAIRDIETEGDMMTHEIIDKLNRTFVTPIDR